MADLAMSSGAASKVLGPRPGKASCSFKEGIVEVVLRIVNGLVAILPLIGGILILAFTVNSDSDKPSSSSVLTSSNSSSEPIAYTAGAVSLVGGALVVIWVVIMLILRLLNIGLLNLGSKYFLAVDVVINIILAVVLVAGGVVSIIAAIEWEDSDGGVFGSAIFSLITCFISAVVTIILAVYMIIYVIKEWNQEIVKYTIKEAITG